MIRGLLPQANYITFFKGGGGEIYSTEGDMNNIKSSPFMPLIIPRQDLQHKL